MSQTSIVLIDDHPLLRRGLAEMFADTRDLDVIGQAGDGHQGIELVLRLKPDFVLLDLHMPGMNGLQVLEELKRLKVAAQIIVLTAELNRTELLCALRLGAEGFILKDTDPEVLLEYVRSCATGNAVLSESLVALVAEHHFETGTVDTSVVEQLTSSLTERERQALTLIAHGRSNKLIARDMRISEGTVKVYVKSLMRKLKMRSRLELATWMIQNSPSVTGGKPNVVH
ncbi:response regulator [Pseudomonas fluorescens]|nr:response regulator [Pseudomonas fluorescens]